MAIMELGSSHGTKLADGCRSRTNLSTLRPAKLVSAGQLPLRVARGGRNQGLLYLRGSEKGTPDQIMRKPAIAAKSAEVHPTSVATKSTLDVGKRWTEFDQSWGRCWTKLGRCRPRSARNGPRVRPNLDRCREIWRDFGQIWAGPGRRNVCRLLRGACCGT